MLLNIIRRQIPCRIASDTDIIRILINPNVVHTHSGRPRRCKTGPVQHREGRRYTKVENWIHWLHRDDTLSDVAIWSHRLRVDGPCLFAAHEPGHVPLRARCVFECVDLVLLAVVPVVVEVSQARGNLLVGSASVCVDGCDGGVVHGGKIYLQVSFLQSS